MKTAGLVFMMIGCAVSMYGTSYAAPSDPVAHQSSSATSVDTASDRPHGAHSAPVDGRKHQAGGKSSGEHPGTRHALDKNHPPGPASQSNANRPSQAPNRQEHSASGNAMDRREPGSDKSVGAAKGGLVQKETVNNALRIQPRSVARPVGPSIENVRHRTPNPAVVGGSANSTTKNTGAINGTRMNRKP